MYIIIVLPGNTDNVLNRNTVINYTNVSKKVRSEEVTPQTM